MIFLQEIWLPFSEKKIIDNFLPDYSFKIATPDMQQHPEDLLSSSGHVWHGVAIGWSKDLSGNIDLNIESSSDRIVGVKMKLANSSLLLLSFYAPTAGRDEEFLEAIACLTECLKSNVISGEHVIIGADANCSNKSSKRRQHIWKQFCEQHDLRIYSPLSPTFHHSNGMSSSCIDMFAASSSLVLGSTRQYCTLDDPLNLSSHDPIETSVSVIQDVCKESKFKNIYNEFNRKKVVWDSSMVPEYQKLATRSLSDALAYWDNPEALPLLSCLVSRLLVKCAALVFETHTPSLKSNSKHPSKKLRQAQNRVRKMFELWKEDMASPHPRIPHQDTAM